MVEDLKLVKLITTIGGEVSILTRAPTSEIVKEIKENVTSDWISIFSVDGAGEPVEFELKREYVIGYLIGKAQRSATPSNLALPMGVKPR